jgi:hypothetical protein
MEQNHHRKKFAAKAARFGAAALLAASMAGGLAQGASAAPLDAPISPAQSGPASNENHGENSSGNANTNGSLSANNQHGNNNGHRTIPVRTATQLELALSMVNPGETIQLAKGTYVGNFSTTRAGTAEKPIRLVGSTDSILINSGTSGTAPACPAPTEGWNSGYGLWLSHAPHWELSGFTIKDSKKGLVIDASPFVTVDGISMTGIEEEGVHFRDSSSDGVLKNSTISHTGLVKPGFGEAVYIGSANSNWKCFGSTNGVDGSDRVQVLNNHIGPFIAAEPVDIKEGTYDGVVRGNFFDGQGITGENSGDSWIDVKGNNYLIEGNTGTFSLPGVFANGYEIHTQIPGWGCGNVFASNASELGNIGGWAIFDASKNCATPNTVFSSNTVTNALKGLTNVLVTPAP